MAGSDGRLATRVAGGILVTRILGFVRERVFAHYFGDGAAADAIRAALRIPNVIRNLLGEGTLSASFVPVFAGYVERGDTDAARRLAAIIASLLVLVTVAAALAGASLAPVITDFAAPGFSGERRDLTVTLVRIMFPMSGFLILSAWCLGILNTYRRFFLAYAAPAVWNIVQIAVMVGLGAALLERSLAVAMAWGALLGSALQIAVQLPATLRRVPGLRWEIDLGAPGVQQVVRAWIPVVIGAGAYQISSIIDTQLASLLEEGAVAVLGYAQLLAVLPVSLFGISVAAVALPELSRDAAKDAGDALRERLATGARRVAYFAVPSAVALAVLAEPLVAALFETGAFGAEETTMTAAVLAAYAMAVPAQAVVKLFASGHYALGDTRTPVKIAILSVALSAGAAFWLMGYFGPAGIAAGAAVGGYANSVLNFGALRRRLGSILSGVEHQAILAATMATVPAALAATLAARLTAQAPTVLTATVGLATFGLTYGAATLIVRHPDALALVARWRARA